MYILKSNKFNKKASGYDAKSSTKFPATDGYVYLKRKMPTYLIWSHWHWWFYWVVDQPNSKQLKKNHMYNFFYPKFL